MHISLAAQEGHHHPGMPIPPVPVDLYQPGHPHLHNLPPHVNQVQPPADASVALSVSQDNVVAVRKSPAKEEMEDEEGEWNVKVGNDPPPLWGKRKACEDQNENGKRARVMFVAATFIYTRRSLIQIPQRGRQWPPPFWRNSTRRPDSSRCGSKYLGYRARVPLYRWRSPRVLRPLRRYGPDEITLQEDAGRFVGSGRFGRCHVVNLIVRTPSHVPYPVLAVYLLPT